jgi:hypothetical protein
VRARRSESSAPSRRRRHGAGRRPEDATGRQRPAGAPRVSRARVARAYACVCPSVSGRARKGMLRPDFGYGQGDSEGRRTK